MKTMTNKLVAMLAILALTACAGSDGSDGANGTNGNNGQPGFRDTQTVTVSTVRTYGSGSSITDGVATLPAGIVNLPLTIQVTSGNAGNGWLSVRMGDTRFCYQGTAPNATQLSGQFIYRGIKVGSNCDTGGATPFANTVTLFEDTEVVVAVLGGGCGSLCQTTAADVTFQIKRF